MTGVVLVTSRSFGSGEYDPEAVLAEAGYRVVRAGSAHDLDELAPLLADADGWIAGTGPVTAAHLDLAPNLRGIARYGVGVDNVDLAAAAARGIPVTHTPGANSAAVAEHTLALLLTALRGSPPPTGAYGPATGRVRPLANCRHSSSGSSGSDASDVS